MTVAWRSVAWVVALVGGLVAEAAGGLLRDPSHWIPDLVVGMAFVTAGSLSSDKTRGGAPALLVLTGLAWFAGTILPFAIYFHRGVLVHAILAFPGWRPRGARAWGVVAGYASTVLPLGGSDAWTIVLGVALLAVAWVDAARASGRARVQATVTLQAIAALLAVLFASSVLRIIIPRGDGVYPALLLYEAGLVAIALLFVLRLRSPAGTAVADLVVELGGDVAGTLRERIASRLGDPSLELGYWSGDGYVTADGLRLDFRQLDGDRSATHVSLDGGPFAVFVHDRAVLNDSASIDAVTRATRLSTSNVQLRARVATAVANIEASSQRLVRAADAERDRLAMRLAGGPERTLARVASGLADVRLAAGSDGAAHLARSRAHIETAVRDLHEVGRGLRPRELEAGSLQEVLAELASRAPLPVVVDARVEGLPAAVRAAVYYLCAEALSNVSKHAHATRALVRLRTDGGRLSVEIEDDGRGGADTTQGTGLAGMRDRLEAIGGELSVTSPPHGGTRLVAGIPLDDEAR